MKAQTPILAIALVGVAVLCLILAVLYFLGVVNVLSFHGPGRHTTHSIVLAVVAVAALVAANFARPKVAS